MNLRTKPRIGVMGPSIYAPGKKDPAREVGRLVAQRGGILICGGGGGAMEAAARGAKDAGGITVGILPGLRAEEANPFIDIPIVTGLGDARNCINALTSEAIIAICGSYGTLSEIALALKSGTPVIALQSWSLIPPAGEPAPGIIAARTPAEAVSFAFEAASRPRGL